MASACTRPKKDDPPPKGTGKGKDGKGKSKGNADDGKGKPAIKQVGEVPENGEEISLTKLQGEKEPDAEPRRQLIELKRQW